jgi:hypothetical protein
VEADRVSRAGCGGHENPSKILPLRFTQRIVNEPLKFLLLSVDQSPYPALAGIGGAGAARIRRALDDFLKLDELDEF